MSTTGISVIVFGGSGMLGSMVTSVLGQNKGMSVAATVRGHGHKKVTGVKYRELDAAMATVDQITDVIGDARWVINCIGIIKPYIHDDNPTETVTALKVNSLFPYLLAQAAEKKTVKVVQIATDCVYSGQKGAYTEKDAHDALDVYGKTKSLGEVYSPNVFHLRCSIIGPEPKAHVSLLDWFLGQAKDASVNGYANHQWNGVTTYHYAKLCQGIIEKEVTLDHIQHIVPKGTITKADMLAAFGKNFSRTDITVTPGEAQTVIDRTLSTDDPDKNREIWAAAGYEQLPTVEQMIEELAKSGIEV